MDELSSLKVLPDERRVIWRLLDAPPVAVRNVRVGDNLISLVAEAELGSGVSVVVTAEQPFVLEIETEFTTFSEQAPAGCTRYLLTWLDRSDVRRMDE